MQDVLVCCFGELYSVELICFNLRDISTVKSGLEDMLDSVVDIFVPLWSNIFRIENWVNVSVEHALF